MARVRSLALRTAALAALAALLDAALRAPPPLPSALREWHRGGHYANYRGVAAFYRDDAPAATPGLERTEDAEVLLLLHGFPTSSHDFRLVHASLNARYRIIAPDLLSFGATDRLRGADATVSVAEQADFVLALLAARGVARYHVLAHDYGDTVLQELLARELEVNVGRGGDSEPGGNGPTTARMLSAVLLNGGVVPGAHRALPIQTLLAAQPWIARFVPEFAARRSLERTFAVPQAREELDAMVAATYHKGGKAALGTLLAYIEERKVHEGRWVGALRRTAVPLRFVCGAEDPISGEHMAEAFTAEVGDGADVVLLRGVGHWPQLEAPQAVVAAVRRFHREIGGVGAADKTQDAET